jgi:phage major head subunit gpT-like protein
MPITQSDIPKALLTTMRTEFLKAVDEGPRDDSWRQFCTEVPSTTDTETYGWLGQIPSMREFLGERVVRDMTETGMTLKNKTWEITIGVKRSAWEDDKIGRAHV